jgi:hypothetical protein
MPGTKNSRNPFKASSSVVPKASSSVVPKASSRGPPKQKIYSKPRSNTVSNANIINIVDENSTDKHLCNASFRDIINLPIFDLANSLPSDSQTINEITLLNNYVRILQEQIFQTHSLDPTGTITKDTSPLKQQNVFCFLKKKKDPKNSTNNINELNKYTGTVRAQGLFEIDGPVVSTRTQHNKLCGSDGKQKFAIQKNEGNPNGVLAISLYQIVNCLLETSVRQNRSKYEQEVLNDYNKYINSILQIYEASRGEKNDDFVNDLMNGFFKTLDTVRNNDEKLEWISRVYGPFLNKGLSDISQAGELAKVYILKYIDNRRGVTNKSVIAYASRANKTGLPKDDLAENQMEIDKSEESFWDITEGLPTLSAFSSDGIASALGVRIQECFKGQFQSIIPRKHGKGRFSVVYIPYKYVSLMILLGKDIVLNTEFDGRIFKDLMDIKSKLISFISYYSNLCILPVNVYTEDFLYKLRILVIDIYKYYRTTRTDFFSKSIIKIIDDDIIEKLAELSDGDMAKLKEILNKFYETYDKIYINKDKHIMNTGASTHIDIKHVLRDCFDFIKQVLNYFGKFIQSLSIFVKNNETALINFVDTMSRTDLDNIVKMKVWTGIIYSTVSYYDNCLYFKELSDEALLTKYLEISKTEELCAEQDVDYGHDQTAKKIQILGDRASKWFDKQSVEGNLRPHISEEKYVNEKTFSKNLIDTLKYCSVAQTYDRDGSSILEVNFTTNPENDFIFNVMQSTGLANNVINNITPIGNAEIWGSIDYTVGDPFINITKRGVNENYSDYGEFTEYFRNENIIEIRTPTTNFDAAAPSGCVFKNVGRMSVSYRKFKSNGNGKEYMYVILTIDISKNEDISGFDTDYTQCQVESLPRNVFFIQQEVTGILHEDLSKSGGQCNKANITLELMREFSKPFVSLTADKAKKLKGASMLALMSNSCYNNPNSELSKMIRNQFSGVTNIFESVKSIKTDLTNNKTTNMTDAQAREQSIPLFTDLINQIRNYYIDCRKKPQPERENCEELLREFLLLLYSCMNLGILNKFEEKIENTYAKKYDDLLDAFQIGDTARILVSLKDIDTSDLDLGAKPSRNNTIEASEGLVNFTETHAAFVDVIHRLRELYPSMTEADAKNIYTEVQKEYTDISSQNIIIQLQILNDYITSYVNPKLLHSNLRPYQKMGTGGKRKTNEKLIHKNKLTKRRKNNRVRKTKKNKKNKIKKYTKKRRY